MESLFSTLFPNADKADWRAQVQNELKGKEAYEQLRWQTGEGFVIEPYYTVDSLAEIPLSLIQAAQKPTVGWLNMPDYQITIEKTDNAKLRAALASGADALLLDLPGETLNLSQLLNGIKLSETPVFFRIAPDLSSEKVVNFVKTLRTIAPYQLRGGLLTSTTDSIADITRLTADSPQFRTVYIQSHTFHNAGATAVQELAFMLASLADAYDTLTDAGLTIDEVVPKTLLSVSIGTSYFLEIAKLRALRVLTNRFLSAFHTPDNIHHTVQIHAQTSTFYDAATTPYTNLIRVTTEAMAAVVGGCDALTIYPYNQVLGQVSDQEFAERIARNVSVLLKQESYFDKVADPSAGSYYIENLTHQIAEAAWALFLDVEKRGGLAKALATGFVQQEINRAYQAKIDAVREGKVLVGVTKYRSEGNKPKPKPEKHGADNTDLLPNRRLAEEFE